MSDFKLCANCKQPKNEHLFVKREWQSPRLVCGFYEPTEPEFIVQPGDYLSYFHNPENIFPASISIGKTPDSYTVRVWRKVDDTTLKVVWEREK